MNPSYNYSIYSNTLFIFESLVDEERTFMGRIYDWGLDSLRGGDPDTKAIPTIFGIPRT